MNIIVIGCGRVGAELAYRLYQHGHQVTVVDQLPGSFESLHPDFRGRTVEGEVLSQDVLRRAGIEGADSLTAVTSSDSVNAVVAHVARVTYNVPNVVVRNYDPHWRPLLEAFGLQSVCPASWGAQRIEELLYASDLRPVFSAGNGEVEIYEFAMPTSWSGRTVSDLFPKGGCQMVAITRAGRASIPSADSKLAAGDVLLVSATLDGIEELRRRLATTKGG
jgi:trk system potassium uptake protein TrkA